MPDNKTNEDQNIGVETGLVEGKKAVRYIGPYGKELYKIDGSKAWRNNNPGNVGCSRYMEELGAIGCDDAGRSIFPDYKTGDRAMERLLKRGVNYKNKTIEEIINKYAPKEGGNPTEKYTQFTSQKTGMPRDKNSGDMTSSEFNSLKEAMQEFEQTNPGTLVEVYTTGGHTSSLVRRPVNVKPGKHYDLSQVEYDVEMRKGAPLSFTGGKDVGIKRRPAPAEKSPSPSADSSSRERKSRVLYPSGPRPEEATVYYSGGGTLPPKKPRHKMPYMKYFGGGETLKRKGDRVYRVEEDGSGRGSFIS